MGAARGVLVWATRIRFSVGSTSGVPADRGDACTEATNASGGRGSSADRNGAVWLAGVLVVLTAAERTLENWRLVLTHLGWGQCLNASWKILLIPSAP
jgi:hypothetical protein